jgi:hypothetical protein
MPGGSQRHGFQALKPAGMFLLLNPSEMGSSPRNEFSLCQENDSEWCGNSETRTISAFAATQGDKTLGASAARYCVTL